VSIKTGFLVELTRTGSRVEILALTLRLTERSILVEYRIKSDSDERDHRNAVVVPLDSIDGGRLKHLLRDVYAELTKLPGFAGTVDVKD
jgi:hypothetical protein